MIGGRSPFFVAEVSSNHHRDLGRCLEFVDQAASCGCDAVKFQLFKIDQLFSSEILTRSAEHRDREQWELPVEFIEPIYSHCKERNIQFSCTPFFMDAVKILEPYVDFYKIASYELLWLDLIECCAKTGKPLVLSTGMATIEEIDSAVSVFRDHSQSELTLLHCVSAYPAPIDQCNLSVIENLRQRYRCNVGWSDHSKNPSVISRSVHRWHSDVIEFHLDLDKSGDEYAAGHCWLPAEIAAVIKSVRAGIIADGMPDIIVSEVERIERNWRADPSDGMRPLQLLRNDFNPTGNS